MAEYNQQLIDFVNDSTRLKLRLIDKENKKIKPNYYFIFINYFAHLHGRSIHLYHKNKTDSMCLSFGNRSIELSYNIIDKIIIYISHEKWKIIKLGLIIDEIYGFNLSKDSFDISLVGYIGDEDWESQELYSPLMVRNILEFFDYNIQDDLAIHKKYDIRILCKKAYGYYSNPFDVCIGGNIKFSIVFADNFKMFLFLAALNNQAKPQLKRVYFF